MSDEEDDYRSEADSEEIRLKSRTSSPPTTHEDDESLRRTSSSLNNYSILPPIKSATGDHDSQPQYFIKQLQEKYQQPNGTPEMNNDAKLDDAYLKMKRLDKALEEAFEKERQVKMETMSLMKQLRSEMQSMTVALNADTNELSHTQSNLKRFLALDDEILKLDGAFIEDDNSNPAESIFKTQLDDPLGDSNSIHKTDKESVHGDTKTSTSNKKKKSSISSNSTSNTKDASKKTKVLEKDFIKRNIQLAKELGGTWGLTDDERQRLNELLNEDDQDNTVALPNQQVNGYLPSVSDIQRLKEIDDLLEKEYYNPLLNHQLRRNNDHDIDYTNIQQITNEENDQLENPFGERVLKETRLQREHMQRLKQIDEKLERLHQSMAEEKVEAILSDEQLNELPVDRSHSYGNRILLVTFSGQCAVDEMKQRFSFLNRDKEDRQEIDFDDLSNYTLTHYVDNNQGPLITDEIIQLLISEAQEEGITMRQFPENNEEEVDSSQSQAESVSLAPAIDRPISSTSTSSHVDLSNRNLS